MTVPVCTKPPHLDAAGLRQRCVRPGGHDSWCLTVNGKTFNDPARCSCDGAAYYTPEENRTRVPFVVNADCTIHGPLHGPIDRPTQAVLSKFALFGELRGRAIPLGHDTVRMIVETALDAARDECEVQ